MRYRSTRNVGGDGSVSLLEAVVCGAAHDGGLFVPESLPSYSAVELHALRELSYRELCVALLKEFLTSKEEGADDIECQLADQMDKVVDLAYSSFRQPDVVKLATLSSVRPAADIHVLELWHGPTFAFKDVALQFLAALLDWNTNARKSSTELQSKPLVGREKYTLLGATSGDTGSAALEAFKGKACVDGFVLYPKGRVSLIQERQMTAIDDESLHAVAVDAPFDACQRLVKSVLRDPALQEEFGFISINSINWARIMAQIVYYFKAYFLATCDSNTVDNPPEITFVVPSGNFGNALACYYAREMGLPINKIVVATNQNDILHRLFQHNDYSVQDVHATHSPAMDIQVASNLERLLHHTLVTEHNGDRNAAARELTALMEHFSSSKYMRLAENLHSRMVAPFTSFSVSDAETRLTLHEQSMAGYFLCPHSAVGVAASLRYAKQCPQHRIVTIATAHAGKFPTVSQKALGRKVPLPAGLDKPLWMKGRSSTVELNRESLLELMRGTNKVTAGSFTPFVVRVPASCANLGPGFDALGIAVGLHLEVQVLPGEDGVDGVSIEFEGEGIEEATVTDANRNLVWITAKRVAQAHHSLLPSSVILKMKNDIPFCRGLGSSAAGTVAGALIANQLCSLGFTTSKLVTVCSESEGHADNVCPALVGGMTSGGHSLMPGTTAVDGLRNLQRGPIRVMQLPIATCIKVVLAIPDIKSPTKAARAAIPSNYPRDSVVFNIQRVPYLLTGLATASPDLVQQGVQDLLHQPYRSSLCPGLSTVLNEMAVEPRQEGLLGACLSGAGSCIMAFASSNFEEIGETMCYLLRTQEVRSEWRVVDVLFEGATIQAL